MNIVIITSDSLRHRYFKLRFGVSSSIKVLRTYVETTSLEEVNYYKYNSSDDLSDIHYKTRHNTERDFFLDSITYIPDKTNSIYIKKGAINEDRIIKDIESLRPDLIITYGCSIIKPKLIKLFKNKIINVHLGISPYYFGSGTNYNALVNQEFQFFGYTIMYMDEGIDTGKIIHQSRADLFPFDNPHQIGNRLIRKMVDDFIRLIENFELIQEKINNTSYKGKTYRRRDANLDTMKRLYSNFDNGAVINYLNKRVQIESSYPLVTQDFLSELA